MIVSNNNNNNAGSVPQDQITPIVVIGRPPNVALPPSNSGVSSGVAPVAPAPPPSSVTLMATNSNGSTTFNLINNNNDDKYRQQNFIPAQQYTPYNTLGGGILNPASNLPSYQPGLKRIPATMVSFFKYLCFCSWRQITLRIVGYHFSSRLTATLNLCLVYFKIA